MYLARSIASVITINKNYTIRKSANLFKSSFFRCNRKSSSCAGENYDVIVVGGGHAGTEAAAASARMGCRTLLITQKIETIGEMSCNPSFGGIGKGHLMREIDALDGLSPKICDLSGVHYRLLNTRKGPAVWGYRAQIDRKLYKKHIQSALRSIPNLTVKAGTVEDLIMKPPTERTRETCAGVIMGDGQMISSRAVVLTTGTFLRGEIVIGLESRPAGRVGDEPAIGLAKTLDRIGFKLGRLKTGTPPRLKKETVDVDKMTRTFGDDPPRPFSFMSERVWIDPCDQLSCYLTYTNKAVAQLINDNLHLNRVVIKNTTGPRYCPSIESKVMRFSNNEHQVWLEPEDFLCVGLDSDLYYPQGLSCTMPPDVQQKIINAIPGLERAVIVRPGYGVEYDFIDPRQIHPSLETRGVKGLFFDGQINGTTGYEEAAAQGILAGINAALRSQNRRPFILSRTESYIGVMLDDLTLEGAIEPYHMFTSRAEFRLYLRPDNADTRLTRKGFEIGCVSVERNRKAAETQTKINDALNRLKDFKLMSSQWQRVANNPENNNSVYKSAFSMLGGGLMSCEKLAKSFPESFQFLEEDKKIAERVAIEAMYSDAVQDQMKVIEELRRDESLVLPPDLDFNSMHLSLEARDKLNQVRPTTIAAANKIPGVTAAAVVELLRYARRYQELNRTIRTEAAR